MRKRVLVVAGAALMLMASGTAYAASPQVTDQQYDGYQGSMGLPNPLLSDPAYDITAVEWAKVGRTEFSVTMTLNGTPEAGVYYLPFAMVGEGYEVFWRLGVGTKATYNVYSVDPATGMHDGHVSTTYGSAVGVSGNTVSATFSTHRNKIARTLRDNPVIGPFGGVTCTAPNTCDGDKIYDIGRSAADARFSLN